VAGLEPPGSGAADTPATSPAPTSRLPPQAAAEAHRAELARLLDDGRRLLAEDERLRSELAGGTVDAAAHNRLRERLRQHRVALQLCQDGWPGGEP
jgi:hypothetical protein